jgi:hypothetical protein
VPTSFNTRHTDNGTSDGDTMQFSTLLPQTIPFLVYNIYFLIRLLKELWRLANFPRRYSDLLILFCCRCDKLTQKQPVYLCFLGFSSICFSSVNNNSSKGIITVIGKVDYWLYFVISKLTCCWRQLLSLTQTLYSRPYMAKFWHKTNNNQSYTLEHWYGESRLWQ